MDEKSVSPVSASETWSFVWVVTHLMSAESVDG